MKETDQRIALCEWAGWDTNQKVLGSVFVFYKRGDPHCHAALPDTSSLDVLHGFEKRLTEGQWDDYANQMEMVLNNRMGIISTRNYMHATAAHRREALLRTLNLWKEDV